MLSLLAHCRMFDDRHSASKLALASPPPVASPPWPLGGLVPASGVSGPGSPPPGPCGPQDSRAGRAPVPGSLGDGAPPRWVTKRWCTHLACRLVCMNTTTFVGAGCSAMCCSSTAHMVGSKRSPATTNSCSTVDTVSTSGKQLTNTSSPPSSTAARHCRAAALTSSEISTLWQYVRQRPPHRCRRASMQVRMLGSTPRESILSASSITTTSSSEVHSASDDENCSSFCNRPGVATRICGGNLQSSRSSSSVRLPPTASATCRSRWWDSRSLQTPATWSASSRVGQKTTARTPPPPGEAARASIVGTK
mmetsp:Transcript_44895/g.118551  ORF Transcript_44895/g.118551 Transcript_44895/m.118551 type:complete len:307 (+) Transcript_44895:418-1338(+)